MEPLGRRKFISIGLVSGAGLAYLKADDQLARSAKGPAAIDQASERLTYGDRMAEEIVKEKVRRAMSRVRRQ
jgi:hypothetical protein